MTTVAERPGPPGGAAAARRQHYAHFHGLAPLPTGRMLGVVHGNCQAESLRIVLEGEDLALVRIPPVHELAPDDLPRLHAILERTQLVVSQPVRAGYRGLPIGTAEVLAAATATARAVTTVIVPVIRFAGLYPAQALVRPPDDPGMTPPLVPYHDLRTLAEAAARAGLRPTRMRALDAERVRAVAAHSLTALRERESRHGAVAVSDLLTRPHFGLMRTINHPGNAIWSELARRVRRRAGLAQSVTDPGRPLLDAIHAPREAEVIEAFGLEDSVRPQWVLDGRPVDPGEVRDAHLEWYARHPGVVRAGLERHRDVLSLLGLE
jgi:hypothetical protein